MKRPKLKFVVNRNNTAKVYINNKWLKDVAEINIHGEPWNYSVVVQQNKRNADGTICVDNNEIVKKIKEYHIKGKNYD